MEDAAAVGPAGDGDDQPVHSHLWKAADTRRLGQDFDSRTV